MTAANVWKSLHVLSLFLYAGGLGGVLVPLARTEVEALAPHLAEAGVTSLSLRSLVGSEFRIELSITHTALVAEAIVTIETTAV